MWVQSPGRCSTNASCSCRRKAKGKDTKRKTSNGNRPPILTDYSLSVPSTADPECAQKVGHVQMFSFLDSSVPDSDVFVPTLGLQRPECAKAVLDSV